MARQLGQSGRGTTRYYSVYWGALPSSGSRNVDHRETKSWDMSPFWSSCAGMVSLEIFLCLLISSIDDTRSSAAASTLPWPVAGPIHWNNNLHCRRVLKPWAAQQVMFDRKYWDIQCTHRHRSISSVGSSIILHWQHCRPSLIGKIFPLLAASWAPA